MRLHLLCAASTSAIRLASFPSNEPLDIYGRKALASFRGGLSSFDTIGVSPHLSAVETAEALGLPLKTDARLRDCDFGRWAGCTLATVQASEPDALAVWFNDPTTAPHGGESFADVMRRVQHWMDDLLTAPGTMLAVTHPTIVRAALASALGTGPEVMRSIDIAPLTRAKLSGMGGRWTLSALLPFKMTQ